MVEMESRDEEQRCRAVWSVNCVFRIRGRSGDAAQMRRAQKISNKKQITVDLKAKLAGAYEGKILKGTLLVCLRGKALC